MPLNFDITKHAITAIDFEESGYTQGFDSQPIQIGMARMVKGTILRETCWQQNLFLAKTHPISYHAYRVHRIRHEDLVGEPTLPELWPTMWHTATETTVWTAHNAACEKKTLHKTFPMHQFDPWLDTLKIARALAIKSPSHSMTELLIHAGLFEKAKEISGGKEPHEALFDAVGCLLLIQWFVGKRPPLEVEHGQTETKKYCEK